MNRASFTLLKKAGRLLNKIISGALIVFMVIMALLMFAQVVLRFFFSSPFTWAEELLRFMYIWLVFLGLPVAVYYNDLTRFDLLQSFLSGTKKKTLETVIYVVSNIILYIIAWGAWRLLVRQVTQRATTMPVPMSIIYMVMPVSAVLSFVFILCKLAMMWSSGTDFEKDEPKC